MPSQRALEQNLDIAVQRIHPLVQDMQVAAAAAAFLPFAPSGFDFNQATRSQPLRVRRGRTRSIVTDRGPTTSGSARRSGGAAARYDVTWNRTFVYARGRRGTWACGCSPARARRSTPRTAVGRRVFGVFAALAEFERELIRERTVAGLDAARARGRKGGRKFALSKAQVKLAQSAMAHRDTSVSELCRELGIRPVTLYRYVGPQGQSRKQGRKVLGAMWGDMKGTR